MNGLKTFPKPRHWRNYKHFTCTSCSVISWILPMAARVRKKFLFALIIRSRNFKCLKSASCVCLTYVKVTKVRLDVASFACWQKICSCQKYRFLRFEVVCESFDICFECVLPPGSVCGQIVANVMSQTGFFVSIWLLHHHFNYKSNSLPQWQQKRNFVVSTGQKVIYRILADCRLSLLRLLEVPLLSKTHFWNGVSIKRRNMT